MNTYSKCFLTIATKEEETNADGGVDPDDQNLQPISGFSSVHVGPPLPMGTVVLLDATSSQREFEDLLSSCYIPMEIWYIRTIIDKVRL